MSIWTLSKSFLIALLTLNIGLGTHLYADEAVYLPKATPAPFEGFLFTIDKTQEIRRTYIEHDNYKLINDSLTKSLGLSNDIISQLQDQKKIVLDRDDQLAKSLRDARSTSDLEKVLWFGGGVIATILVLYGVQRLSSH